MGPGVTTGVLRLACPTLEEVAYRPGGPVPLVGKGGGTVLKDD